MRIRCIVQLLACAYSASIIAIDHAADRTPATLSAAAEDVRDFAPIVRHDQELQLYARSYRWTGGVLPEVLVSRGEPVLKDIELRVTTHERSAAVRAASHGWHDESGQSVRFEARGEVAGITVTSSARIDLDGLIDIELELNPLLRNDIERVSIVARLPRSRYSVYMGYAADGIRTQKGRSDLIGFPFDGRFRHALSVGDGERGVWWFADSRQGWVGPAQGSMQLVERDDEVELVLALVNTERGHFRQPTSIRFGLLATPVKRLAPAVRRQRAVIGPPSIAERELGARYKLWWPTAVAYDAYPYTSYQGSDADELDDHDLNAYPGLQHNRRLVADDRRKFAVEWMPYFSAHVLSELDPELRRQRATWHAQPVKRFKDGLNPYSNAFAKPVLSHNAPGYSDYVIGRLSRVVEELDASGLYLDHGPPVDSRAANSGGWRDAAGIWQPSLDIFAERTFLRRLRSALRADGRAGTVFVHASNRELAPAFTFVHAIVDGEQYRNAVVDGHYLDLVSLDEFRARFAPRQSGILNYWLPGDWYANRHDPTWRGSAKQLHAFRRVMALALLHDVALWPQGAAPAERRRLFKLLDKLHHDQAIFRGYWRDDALIATNLRDVPISAYIGPKHLMAVLVNQDRASRTIEFMPRSVHPACKKLRLLPALSDGVAAAPAGGRARLRARDFALATFTLEPACRAALLE